MMKKNFVFLLLFICVFLFVACDPKEPEIEDENGEFSWTFEPKEKGKFDVVFDVCHVLNYGDLYSTGSDFIELSLNGDEWCAYFDMFAPLGSVLDVYGTYVVKKDNYEGWAAVPSSGGNDDGDTPSFFGTEFTEDSYYTVAYYVKSGKVVVAKDGVTIDVVTHYGSSIKASYKGEVNPLDYSDYFVSVPQSKVEKERFRLVKASVDDIVYWGVLKECIRK